MGSVMEKWQEDLWVCICVLGPEMGQGRIAEQSPFVFLLDEGKLFASKEEKTYRKKSHLKLCFCDHILKWRDLSEPFSSRSWLNWIPTGENEFLIRTYLICLK